MITDPALSGVSCKRRYSTPVLEVLGSVSDLVMANGSGTTEGNNDGTMMPGGM